MRIGCLSSAVAEAKANSPASAATAVRTSWFIIGDLPRCPNSGENPPAPRPAASPRGGAGGPAKLARCGDSTGTLRGGSIAPPRRALPAFRSRCRENEGRQREPRPERALRRAHGEPHHSHHERLARRPLAARPGCRRPARVRPWRTTGCRRPPSSDGRTSSRMSSARSPRPRRAAPRFGAVPGWSSVLRERARPRCSTSWPGAGARGQWTATPSAPLPVDCQPGELTSPVAFTELVLSAVVPVSSHRHGHVNDHRRRKRGSGGCRVARLPHDVRAVARRLGAGRTHPVGGDTRSDAGRAPLSSRRAARGRGAEHARRPRGRGPDASAGRAPRWPTRTADHGRARRPRRFEAGDGAARHLPLRARRRAPPPRC